MEGLLKTLSYMRSCVVLGFWLYLLPFNTDVQLFPLNSELMCVMHDQLTRAPHTRLALPFALCSRLHLFPLFPTVFVQPLEPRAAVAVGQAQQARTQAGSMPRPPHSLRHRASPLEASPHSRHRPRGRTDHPALRRQHLVLARTASNLHSEA